MDTCSLCQALELLQTKAAEQPLRSLVERSPELQQARRTEGLTCRARACLNLSICHDLLRLSLTHPTNANPHGVVK